VRPRTALRDAHALRHHLATGDRDHAVQVPPAVPADPPSTSSIEGFAVVAPADLASFVSALPVQRSLAFGRTHRLVLHRGSVPLSVPRPRCAPRIGMGGCVLGGDLDPGFGLDQPHDRRDLMHTDTAHRGVVQPARGPARVSGCILQPNRHLHPVPQMRHTAPTMTITTIAWLMHMRRRPRRVEDGVRGA